MANATNPFEYAQQLHRENPAYPAYEVADRTLQAFPTTPRSEMIGVLTYAGFSSEEANIAVAKLYGNTVEFSVSATEAWQHTGIIIEGEEPTTIDYINGQWTTNPQYGMVGPDGNPEHVARIGSLMPGVNEGALLGLIGKQDESGRVIGEYPVFIVGKSGMVPIGLKGSLFLSINDNVNELKDNEGQVTVNIVKRAPVNPDGSGTLE